MNKKVCVIGNYGNPGNENNGQTIKTKTIVKALVDKYGKDAVIVADTNRISNKTSEIIQGLFYAIVNADLIVLAVCDYAIKLLAVPIFLLAKIQRKRIIYILIGGWLGRFVEKHPGSRWALKRYDYIFAETKVTGEELKKQGFSNISYIDNCKYLSLQGQSDCVSKTNIKFCTLSRVVPEKGIEEAINAVVMASQSNELSYSLDIYGEISPDYKEQFDRLINLHSRYVRYKGIAKFNDCPKVISAYDALLFPTRVMTEGMPGTVIDAMFAGTPVIATRWNACQEIIKDGYNGFSYLGNETQLYTIISRKDIKETLVSMRQNCLIVAKRFTPEVALSPLFRIFEE